MRFSPCLPKPVGHARFQPGLLIIAVFLFLVTAGAAPVSAAGDSLDGQRILVLGDSITQDGRYVSFTEFYLRRLSPPVRCDLISIGLSSETVSGLSENGHPYPRPCVLDRLDRALAAVKPAVVIACYGMNDGIYHPSTPERLAAFTTGLRTFIERVRAAGARLILLTPPVFDPLPIRARVAAGDAKAFGYGAPFSGYDEVLAEFARAEVSLREPGVTVIDLHTAMAAALAERRERDPTFSFAADGVHPGDAGHALIARTLLAGLGYSLPPPETDAELAALPAEPLFSVVALRRQLRSEAWLPFVGYTRGETYKTSTVDAAEKAAARLLLEADTRR